MFFELLSQPPPMILRFFTAHRCDLLLARLKGNDPFGLFQQHETQSSVHCSSVRKDGTSIELLIGLTKGNGPTILARKVFS